MRYVLDGYIPSEFHTRFPFRQDNRKLDGTSEASDATEDNIKGTSVDRYDPMWPRWRKTPPLHGEGEFVSHEPFFDIDEIMERVDFYPVGRPLLDHDVDREKLVSEAALAHHAQFLARRVRAETLAIYRALLKR
jgi:hypothetical protein